ncbi:MAG: S1C family serine protease [Ferrovibrio sp.]|uniref:S1C family serine protease n=1 Tax=Ferrovibrio sp. TaxID=1917215 RepID=UPI00391BA8A8
MWRFVVMVGVALFCANCRSVATAPPVIEARAVTQADGTVIEPAKAHGGIQPDMRPIGFSRVQTTVPRGAVIGEARFKPLTCYYNSKLHYDSDRKLLNAVAYNDIFYRVFDGHGYRVVGNPNALFETSQRDQPDFLAGANISNISGDFCRHVDSWSGVPDGNLSGTLRVTVNWQIYDPLRRQVVWQRDVEGVFESKSPLPGDYDLFVQHAFADTANKVAADASLRAIVSQNPLREAAAGSTGVPAPRRPLLRQSLSAQPIDRHIDQVRAATVLIEVGEGSHGSGFLVSEDGLVLTNQHVVGGQRFVRVRLVSGRTLIGEVLRRHEARDVALLKLEGSGYPTLPIRESPVRVAEEVYAIGAPQMTSLAWTVTRGVVSAWRPARPPGQPYELIQADVPIHGGNSGGPLLDRQGNAVGIAVIGWASDSSLRNTSLNGFIPILDGLDKLGLDLTDPAPYERWRRGLAQN